MSRLFPTNRLITGASRTRTLVCAGLTSVLLPLALAAPAAAAPPTSVGTPAPAVGSSAPAKATATMRISGPTGAVPPGRHTVGVRLLANGRYYPNRYVRIEKTTSRGWVQIGRLLTDANGLGRGQFSLTDSTRVRARYDGGATSTTGISPEVAVTVARPKAAASFRTQAFRVAAAQSGKPYRYGAAGPSSFDCSGLVGYAYRSVGKNLPRTSAAIKAATRPISKAAAVPGDLIFMPGHVGVYAGDGKMVDSPRPGRNVSVRKIWTSNYAVHRVV